MKRIISISLFLLVVTANLFSQWNSNPGINFQLCNAAGYQKSPVVVSDGNGGTIAAWLDERIIGSTTIFVQRFNASGVPQWQANGINLNVSSTYPASLMAIPDGSNGIIVCWLGQTVGNNPLYHAQKVNSSGIMQWASPVTVCDNYTAANADDKGCITSDLSGGVIVCYRRYNNAISKFEIHAQNITSGGTRGWGTNGVILASSSAVSYDYPKICTDGAGGMIAAYNRFSRVYAQRVNSIGMKQWGSEGFDIYAGTVGSMTYPVICQDGLGGAIITALDERTPANEYDIYAQRVKNGTSLWGTAGKPIAVAGNRQWRVNIVYDENYGAYISWDDERSGTSFPYIQRISFNGDTYFQLNGIKAATQTCGVTGMTINDSSAVYMVLSSAENFPSIQIYAQKILSTGSLPWGTDIVPVSLVMSSKSFYQQSFTADNTGGIVCVWEDNRNTDPKIYGHKVQSSGLTGVSNNNEIPSEYSLGQNYPNPFNPATTISFSIPKAGLVKLTVFDITGKEIVVLINENISAGIHDVSFSASQLSSGAYFYKLTAGEFTEVNKMILVK